VTFIRLNGAFAVSGAYRRRVRTEVIDPKTVRAAMEDDFHHFAVTLVHDGQAVVDLRAESLRYPWSTCPDAGALFVELRGVDLSERSSALGRSADPTRFCTHQFDLAGLAVAQAARAAVGRGERRQYDAVIPDRVDGTTMAQLYRDAEPVLSWELRGFRITAPERWRGRPIQGGRFIAWAEQNLAPDDAEAAMVLRRAVQIAAGRGFDLDSFPNIAALRVGGAARCYSFQPERAGQARRMVGTSRDHSGPGATLLDDPADIPDTPGTPADPPPQQGQR